MADKPILMDGAVGTSLWKIAEEAGVEKIPVWHYNLEHPEFVTRLCREYIEAGSQMILTNSFGANGKAVRRAGDYDVKEVLTASVRLAKEAAAGTDVKVIYAAGPLPMLMEPWGDLTEEETAEIYEEHLSAGAEAGADAIYLQTFIDLGMMKVATRVAKQFGLPVYCNMTFEKVGKTMMGNSVQDVIDELTPFGIDAIGMNCSTGPDEALPIIREFAEKTDLPLMFKPNAGKPILAADGTTLTDYDAAAFVREVQPALPLVTYIGGCCGSDPSYIRALKEAL